MPDTTTVTTTVTAIDQLESVVGFSLVTFFFGAAGSMISWRYVPQLGTFGKVTAMVSAGLLSMFLTPILGRATGVQDQDVLFGASGLIGVFGLSITALLFDVLKHTQWSMLANRAFESAIDWFFGTPKDKGKGE